MPWFTCTSTLKIIDSVAIVIAQAYQLARCRLASTASSTLQLMMERDELHTEVQWLKRELSGVTISVTTTEKADECYCSSSLISSTVKSLRKLLEGVSGRC